jgi:hypothetical protein
MPPRPVLEHGPGIMLAARKQRCDLCGRRGRYVLLGRATIMLGWFCRKHRAEALAAYRKQAR